MQDFSDLWISVARSLGPVIARHGDFLFGWIFGLIGSGLPQIIKSQLEKKRFKKAIQAEFLETRFKVISTILPLSLRLGFANRSKLELLRNQSMSCADGEERDTFNRLVTTLLALTDDQLEQYVAENAATKKAKVVPRIESPFLSGNAHRISLLRTEEQIALVKVLSRISTINGKIEDMDYWNKASHTTSPQNYDATINNAFESMAAIIAGCEQLWKAMEQFSMAA